jgi:YD repeat-containing protein
VDQARTCMPLRAVLQFLGMSPNRFQTWRRRQNACALDDESSCPRAPPHRLTLVEVQAIGDMVTSPSIVTSQPARSPCWRSGSVPCRRRHRPGMASSGSTAGHALGGYVIRDPVGGGEHDMSLAALTDESSGTFLTSAATASSDFAPITEAEAEMMQGPGCPPGNPTPDDGCHCGAGGSGGGGGGGGAAAPPTGSPTGMPTYDFHPLGALQLSDTPVGYTPPRGPAVLFRMRYNHRLSQADYTTSHVGRNWGFEWSSAVIEPEPVVGPPYLIGAVRVRDGGMEHFGLMDPSPYNWRTRAQIVAVSTNPVRYERRLTDGTVEVFDVPDRPAGVLGRQVLISQVIDPRGQSIQFSYNTQFRLTAVTDALGQVTTLSYDDRKSVKGAVAFTMADFPTRPSGPERWDVSMSRDLHRKPTSSSVPDGWTRKASVGVKPLPRTNLMRCTPLALILIGLCLADCTTPQQTRRPRETPPELIVLPGAQHVQYTAEYQEAITYDFDEPYPATEVIAVIRSKLEGTG